MKRSEFDKKFKEIAKKAKALSDLWIQENAKFHVGDRINANGLNYIIKNVGWQHKTDSMIRYQVEIEGKESPFLITEEKLIEEVGGGT